MWLTRIFRRRFRLEVARVNRAQTSKQSADIEDKRTSLRNRILQWRQVQLAYTPCVVPLIAQSLAASPDTLPDIDESLLPIEPAESISLYLPSSLPQRLRLLPDLAN